MSKRVAIYTHHTGRFLGKLELSDEQVALLHKPPELTPTILPDGTKKWSGEDHVLDVETSAGKVRLFKVTISGVERVVTPDHVIAAAGQ